MKKISTFLLSLLIFINAYTQCPIIVSPSNIIVNNDESSCGAIVLYDVPFILDTCSSFGFNEDFESGFLGWTTGSYNTLNNWRIQNISGVETPLGTNMLGVPHSGNYAFGGKEHSFIQSPLFNTSGGGEFSFDYFVNNEPAVHDQEIVEISFNGGVSWSQLVSNQLPNNEFTVQSISFSISALEGSEATMVRFTYNTVDACCGAQDGFFVDNVRFKQNTFVQLISGMGSGSNFPIGVTNEVYLVNNDTVLFTVTVNSIHNTAQTFSICYGEHITVGTNSYYTTGIYTDTLTTVLGCDSIITTNLMIKNSIDTTLFIDDRLIISNEVNASYQWLSCATMNTPINGANDREFLANENGNYAVVISKDGCEKISSSVTIMSVGVGELNNDNEVNVYPNPFIDNVNVVFNQLEKNTSISVFDLTGKELHQINNVYQLKTEIDMSSYSTGVYFVKTSNNNTQQLIKLIKN